MSKKLLKVLNSDMESPYHRMKYKKNKAYHCDNFDESDEDCSRGLYAVDWDGLSYAYRHEEKHQVWECEVWGKEKEINPFKRRYENIKLLRKLSLSEIKQGLKDHSEEAGYNLYLASFPKNPLTGAPKKPTQNDIDNLKAWASVRAYIGAYIGASLGDSFWAYISSMFPSIKKWKYVDHEGGKNPYQPAIDLWNNGFVASYDGTTWRLHSGKDAEIVYELIETAQQALHGEEEEDEKQSSHE